MQFVDFRTGETSERIATLFPGWESDETVAFLSPHDDDVALGAGFLVRAVIENGGVPLVLVFCKGDAGYSHAREKATIVRTRRRETAEAYRILGVEPADIHLFGIPDLSLMPYVNRKVPGGAGIVDRFIRLLRSNKVSRTVIASPNFENWDHTAVFNLGVYCAPQAGDPILADLGEPCVIRSGLIYSVWGDFGPAGGGAGGLRAEAGILAGENEERLVREALGAFVSQAAVMENTAARQRESRRGPEGYLELYQRAGVRKPIDYTAYFERIRKGRV